MQDHFFVLGKWLSNVTRLAFAVCLASLLFLGIIPLAPKTLIVYAQGNTLTGLVFQDYNADGFRNLTSTPSSPALDPPVAGVTVTAYDVHGQIAGSAVTGADGKYTIAVQVPGPFRVEFAHFPPGLRPGFTSVSSQSDATNPPWTEITAGSTAQFVVGDRATNVNLALANPADYCQAEPDLVTTAFAQDSGLLGTDASHEVVIKDFPYTASGTTPSTHALNIPQADVGTVWGLAYQRSTDQVYAAAYMKRFAPFGPSGTGAIYRIQRKPDPGQAQLFVDLNALFGPNTTGPDLHNFALHKDYKADSALGLNTIDAVGKTSLGGLAIDDTERRLYVMNLYDRQLYEIPLDTPPTASNIRRTPTPLNQNTLTKDVCPNPATDIRPFAVEYHQGLLYVGMVCSGESSPLSPEFATWQDSNGDGYWNLGEPYTDLNGNGKLDYHITDDLHAYVYTVDPATLTFNPTPVLSFPLNYPGSSLHAGVPADWNTWQPLFRPLEGARFAYPQPMLTAIAFDRDNMLLGLRDRFGDQAAYRGVVVNPNAENNLSISSGAGGDILRACGSTASGWQLENNAQCGGITTAGANDGQGPGNGEYYFQDSFGGHSETIQGSLVNVPGFPQVVANAWDVLALNSQGTRWLNNANGAQEHAYFIMPDSTIGNTRWGKSNGLGDLVALCDPAPMEIGNHIWLDANGNGIQDPNEAGIAGVTVHLYRPGFGPDNIPGTPDDNASLAIAVSDAYGDYYFDNGPGPDPLLDEIGIVTDNLKPGGAYEIRLDKPADAQANGPLNGLTVTGKHNPTGAPSGSTLSDSDADTVINPIGSPLGAFAVITYTVGPPGTYDHSLDFGFTPAGVSVGNQVWFDTNANGQVDPQEVGIANVTVELFRDVNGDNTLTGAEQTASATQKTTAEGFYLFTQDSGGQPLAPGNYVVGIAPTNFAPGGVLVGYLSSRTSMTSNGSVTEVAAPAANNNADNDDNGQKLTTGFYAGGRLSSVASVFNDEPENETPGNKPGTLAGTTPGFNDPNRNNTSNLTVDFGFYQLFLGDSIFLDEGNNGLRDGSDSGVNNVNVRLCAADGVTEIPVGPDGILGTVDDVLGGVVTANLGAGAGQYRFGGLPQGAYVICLTPPLGYTSSTGNPLSQSSGPYEPGPAPDTLNAGKLINNDDNGAVVGNLIQSQPVNLVAGEPHLPNPSDINYQTGATLNNTVDFGLIRVVDVNLYSVGNRVWLDNGVGLHTNNGVRDSDERGAPNITVTLYTTVTGVLTPIAQTQTDAAGYYRFSDLNPGDYVVQVAKPSGAVSCTNGVETDPNLDGDSNPNGVNDLGNSVRSQTLTLGPGDSEPLNEGDLATDGQGSLDARANMTLDFCFVLNHPLSIGNQVYQDHSNDGYFAPANDVGLAGVQVNLYYDLNNDGKVDETEAATPYLTTTTTISGSVAGAYLFSNLPSGNFVLELPPSDFAAGGPLAGYLSCSGVNGSITGPAEPARDPDDPQFAADTVDVGSAYLNPGTGAHSIRSLPITLQPNTEPLLLTQPDGNGILNDGILDPKEDPLFNNDPTTADGDSNLLADFCVFKPYSLGNRVWFDANGNGSNDTDEPGIANVVVTLYDVANTLVATTTTDALGYYRFDYLTAGDYTVDVATPTSPVTGQLMVSSTPDGGDPDANPTDRDDNGVALNIPGHVRSLPVTLGDANASDSEPMGETDLSPLAGSDAAEDARANLTVDFGFYDPVNLGNHVFNDAENLCYRVSGQRTGLPDVQVYLYEDRNADSIPDGAAVMSQTTDLNGHYLFTNLRPGAYLVQVIPPPGFISSTGQQGGRANGPCEGADAPDPNAGPGGGVDNDDNGMTLPDGRIFSQPLTLQSRAENAQDESADANTNLTLDFGLFKPLGLGNLVWDDLNDNGLQDADEPGLAGVAINLYYDGNFDGVVDRFELATPVSTTMTTNGGQYLFQNLGRGGYVVELAPSNFAADGKLANYLSSNGTPTGQLGPYEPAPDPNATVGPHGNPIDNDDNGQAFTTATGGHTLLSQQVSLEAAAAPLGETPDNAPDLPDPDGNLTVDFGLYVPFSLGNRVWVDANNNGRIDADEKGVGNVQVNLYQSDGATKVDSTLTDASGYYRFDGLRADAYLVGVDAGNFVSPTETSTGALLNYLSSTSDKTNKTDPTDSLDNGVGNTPDPENGVLSPLLQLGPNGGAPLQETDLVTGTNPQGAPDRFANMTVDFGFYQPVCVGHRVWLDVNKDGVQEAGEAGIAGVTVTLYRGDNTEVAHMATLADGNYQFCNLPPGDYYVQFTLPQNYQLSPPDQGPGDTQDSDVDPTTGRTPVIDLQSGEPELKWDAGIYIAPTALDETAEPTQVYRLFMPIVER